MPRLRTLDHGRAGNKLRIQTPQRVLRIRIDHENGQARRVFDGTDADRRAAVGEAVAEFADASVCRTPIGVSSTSAGIGQLAAGRPSRDG